MYAVRVYPKRGRAYWHAVICKLKREACVEAEELSEDDSVAHARVMKVYVEENPYYPSVIYKDGKKVK